MIQLPGNYAFVEQIGEFLEVVTFQHLWELREHIDRLQEERDKDRGDQVKESAG